MPRIRVRFPCYNRVLPGSFLGGLAEHSCGQAAAAFGAPNIGGWDGKTGVGHLPNRARVASAAPQAKRRRWFRRVM